MTDEKKLQELRGQIDAIDSQMLDLLKKRAEVVAHVGEVKGKLPVYIRPGREAKMLRALLTKDSGRLPKKLIHRLWREMIGAFTLQEGALRVAVAVPPGEEGLWDMARDHFGAFTPMEACTAVEALQKVTAKTHQVAALPYPAAGDEAWWSALLADGAPKVFYRYPFDGEAGNARPTSHGGVLVGHIAPEETGNDRTVLAVEWKSAPQNVEGQGAHVQASCSWIELDGFALEPNDALNSWLAAHKDIILRAKIIGAYPVPVA
ncbi:MAG TPA: chorismate mutase [Alphaproteobacteria bacterium]|nr:chorismate mutase [Alphaproteobacteria bacterium]